MNLSVLVVLAVLRAIHARQGFGPGEQDWGYVTVREGAHMFWWLYFTTADVKNYVERPLVIYVEGGPGVSSTGYGNFKELGPLDRDLNKRNYTWVKDVNVLFVDNPVGTGFSYVDSATALTKTNREIAEDFVEFMRGFYNEHPEFVPVPLYIVSESYGGKMTPEIALVLEQAIEEGSMNSNFLGIGLGDAWVDSVATFLQWAPYLLAVGAVDQSGHDIIAKMAQETKSLYNQGLYLQSQNQLRYTMGFIKMSAACINEYNSSLIANLIALDSDTIIDTKLDSVMFKVQEALGLNVTWDGVSRTVYDALKQDFMKSVTSIGTVMWVDNLKWVRSSDWKTAKRKPIAIDGIYEGFEKEVGNLALYWVNRAGHMVPSDNPAAMDYILRKLTQNYNGTLRRQ